MAKQPLDLLVAEDVRAWPLAPGAEQILWWDLVARLLGVHESGKPDHHPQTVFALRLAQRCPGPVDGGARDHEPITSRRGIGDEAAQVGLVGLELESQATAHGEVTLQCLAQHGATSGQGLATA